MAIDKNITTVSEETQYQPKKKKYKFGTIVPLIGGMTVGNSMATGHNPDFLISYPGFASNDSHIQKYMPEVPYYKIDPETNLLMEPTEEEPTVNEGVDTTTFDGVDFISAVCPCAGLSMMNASNNNKSSSSRGSDAQQNDWIYKSAEFVLEQIKPKVFFGENAPGLYTNTGKGVVERLKEIAKSHGYTLSLFKTNTIFHGIPQKRERTFYFFWKEENKVPVFSPYRREHTTLAEYLSEVPEDAPQQDIYAGISQLKTNPFINFIKDHVGEDKWREETKGTRTATNFIVSKGLLKDAKKWVADNYHPENEKSREKTIKYLDHIQNKVDMKKGWWDGTPHFFDETINAVIGRTILAAVHPEEERGLNIREIMWLMGLPHDFTIPSSGFYNHVAQNVPTCTARDVTFEVLRYIDGEIEMHEDSFIKQNNTKLRIDTPIKAVKLF